MRVEDVMVEAHKDFQRLGIVLFFKEMMNILFFNCTYTLCTLFGMFNRFQNFKSKDKKRCLWGQASWSQILIPLLN